MNLEHRTQEGVDIVKLPERLMMADAAGARATLKEIIGKLADRGAEAIILGCTEISLLVEPSDASVPLFDTTRLHALAAAEWSLAPSITNH